MRGMGGMWRGVLLAGMLAGCGTDGRGGPQGPDGGGQAPAATVTVGDNFFRSDRNRSANPAVDTVRAGGTVRFTWSRTGASAHSVESEDEPHFASSDVLTASGSRYDATFPTAGRYEYDCGVHEGVMTGVVVVLAR